jgi:2',3'-cyclic-nucleotide 2'-phosphodiesterase (5'-nucleotidase family)
LLVAVLLAGVLARAQGQPATTMAPAQQVRLTLVHINDPHGQLLGRTENGKTYGGYARLATYVDALRQAGTAERLMLIHAGDEFSKADDLTRATQGRVNVAVMNLLKFDLWVPGNGEYYGGVEVLKARMAEAKCKVLSANVAEKSGKLLAEPYVIEPVGGAKVAIFGLGYMHAPQVQQTGLVLTDPIAVARKLLPKGRLVKDPDGKNVLICQTGEFLHNAGRVDMQLTKTGARWQVTEATARLDVLDDKVKQDPAITALLARAAEAATQPAQRQVPATLPAR